MRSFRRGHLHFLIAAALCLHASGTVQADSQPDPDGDPPLKQGFLKKHVYFAISGGEMGIPQGTLISHEQAYEESMRRQLLTGALRMRMGNVTIPSGTLPGPIPTSFSGEGITQVDMEYALLSHLAVGLSYSAMKINYTQQDGFAGFTLATAGGESTLVRQDFVFALPIKNSLYDGRLLQVVVAAHAFQDSRFDPYVAARIGVSKFTTMAHQDLNVDPYRYARNPAGTGTALGAGVGFNLHFSWECALRIELGMQRQFLKSDIFASRTLTTHHVLAGFVVNLTRFTDSEE